MRFESRIQVSVLSIAVMLHCPFATAQQMIARDSKIIEEQMAVVNAGRELRNDDVSVTRFRFLLSELAAAAGETPREIGDKINVGRKAIRDRFGRTIGLLELTEAAYRARATLQRNQFDKYLAQLVIVIGAQ